MKKRFAIITLLCLTAPLYAYSTSDTGNQNFWQTSRADSIPDGYLLVPRHSVDKALADAAMLEYFKQEFPKIETLKDLYKKGYHIAIKIDTTQEHRFTEAEEIILLTDENFQAVKKRLRKNKWEEFWMKAKDVSLFVSGAILGGIIGHQIATI